VLLAAGQYTWRFVGGAADGSELAPTAVDLKALVLDDPIGPPLIDPTEVPPPPEPNWLLDGFREILALIDPSGRALPPPRRF
jgi:hypothetical protein